MSRENEFGIEILYLYLWLIFYILRIDSVIKNYFTFLSSYLCPWCVQFFPPWKSDGLDHQPSTENMIAYRGIAIILGYRENPKP